MIWFWPSSRHHFGVGGWGLESHTMYTIYRVSTLLYYYYHIIISYIIASVEALAVGWYGTFTNVSIFNLQESIFMFTLTWYNRLWFQYFHIEFFWTHGSDLVWSEGGNVIIILKTSEPYFYIPIYHGINGRETCNLNIRNYHLV